METSVKLSLPPVPDADTSLPSDDDAGQQEAFAKQAADVCDVATSAATNPQRSQQQHRALQAFVAVFKEWAGAHRPFHVFVSGSYRLGVHDNGADIDVLFVTTNSVSRADVFKSFVKTLETLPDVTNLQPVPKAKVPVISLAFRGQEFDVLTCHLKCTELPAKESLLTSYEWMNCMEEECILAFNGPRVTEMILASVRRPNQFCTALRYVREWAKRRCVYSNKSGYLGGVNLALMLLYAAQRRPHALAFQLVLDFFAVFSRWRWNAHNAVRLDAHVQHTCPVWLQQLEWAPRTNETMVVLTACFPRFNTTYSASKYSSGILQREFERASACVDAGRWSDACNELDVFVSCKRFIKVSFSSPDTRQGMTWIGYMQAQTRHLVQLLDNEELAVDELRYVPRWCETTGVSDVHAETFLTADDDGKPRSYLVRGNLVRPLTYFEDTFANAGPPRPVGSTVQVAFCSATSVPESLRAYSLRASARAESDVQELVAKRRRESYAQTSKAEDGAGAERCVDLPVKAGSAKRLRERVERASVSLLVRQNPPRLARKRMVVSILDPPSISALENKQNFVRPVVAHGTVLTPYDVFIGNASNLGTLFFAPMSGLGPPTNYNGDAVEYETELFRVAEKDKDLRNRLISLLGKTLACWCVPAGRSDCHGHVLLRVARRLSLCP